jgi:HPt (histidine-containing phosphotransfer) domain-containing protein
VIVPHPGARGGLDRPACTPAAIRAVLAANAGPEVLARYDAELDAAFEQARQDEDLTALVATVRRWWFEADAWRDPAAQREFLARVDRYAAEEPPPPELRVNREEIRARYGV